MESLVLIDEYLLKFGPLHLIHTQKCQLRVNFLHSSGTLSYLFACAVSSRSSSPRWIDWINVPKVGIYVSGIHLHI